ncbi:membrane protein DedA, SNARE-associated domain [Raineyella antarctica]|uniref:Membrane protein DedA, SNARE-associated domain n=1 Tax=Raineyella antarctica TaxID=1577474 RepID=A0A1G6GY49_9ACTN|nr:DedA family protein [Raineyella antarctica]SDB86919.1 membrane protein DedA, SNARE-associated domain [Raineyella antarctica]
MGWIDTIVEWITNLMQAIGGPGVFLAVLLENVFPPIPSEVILPLAGFTAAGPDAPYGVVAAILWATAGSLAGAAILYWLGWAVGAARLRWIADRMPLVDARDVDKSIDWFTRHGSVAILIGRLVPGVRSLISIPAGIDQMPLLKFGLYTALGSAIWNTVLVVAGYLLGDNWRAVTDWMDRFSTVVYIILALALVAGVVWLVRRAIQRRREALATKPVPEPPKHKYEA